MLRFAACCTCVLLSSGCGAPAQQARSAEPADLLLHSGHIVPMDDTGATYETIAIRDGKVIAVGAAELRTRFRAAREIDLRGRTVTPGFNDAHIHIDGAPRRQIDTDGVKSIVDLQQRIRDKAAQLGPGEWITGYGWSEDELAEKRKPVRADLDAAAPQNPVMMTRAGGHSASFNSLALKLGSVSASTRDPEGGVIERDARGEPTGIIREKQQIVAKLIPAATPMELRESFIANLRKLLALGITSIIQAGVDPDDEFRMWESVYGEHGSTLPRATVQIGWPGADRLKAFGRKTGDGNDRFRVGAIKVFVDGGFTGPAAYTLAPYKGQRDYRGKLVWSERELYDILSAGHAMGWQLGLHTIGDGAIVLAVDTFERVLKESPRADHRHYLNHFSMLPPEGTLRKMRELGLLIAQQPNFTYTLEGRYAANLDKDRLARNNPVATPLAHGIFMAFSSDILPIGPMVGIYAAATRKGMSGAIHGAEEHVSVGDALKMYTRNGAFITREENAKGTLEPGRIADLVVFAEDPLHVDPDRLKDVNIDITVVGGRVLFERAVALPPPFPRDGATKLIENERVTVWQVTWAKGVKTPLHEHRLPTVGVVLQPGTVTMTMGDGSVRPAPLVEKGRVVYAAPGFSHVEEGQSDPSARAIVVELKGTVAGSMPAPPGIPAAFPRAGTTSVLENDRVAVWNVTWPSGEAPMHFHGTDVVVIGLENGTTRSLPQTGASSTTAWKFGDVRFNPRGRLHREEIVEGAPRLIAIELK